MKNTPKAPIPDLQEKPLALPVPDIEENLGTTPNSAPPPVIPPHWAWHYRTLSRLHDRLLQEYAQHKKDAIAPSHASGADSIDQSEDNLWRELAAEGDRLFEVDCALQRIRDGLYGICEETGHAIPDDRLRAIPWARYCRSAAEEHEHHVPRKSKRL